MNILRQMLFGIGRIIKRFEFTAVLTAVIGILGIILPNIPEQTKVAYFNINSPIELAIYVGSLLLIMVCVIATIQLLGIILITIAKNLPSNISIVEYLQKDSKPKYISLEIINHEKTDLEECYGTLETIYHCYSTEAKIDIFNKVNPNRRLLSWGAGSETEYVNIPKDNGSKVLNIAAVTENGGFKFVFFNWESDQRMSGRYLVNISVNGKLEGIPIKTITYTGGFESENYVAPIIPVVAFWGEDDKGKRINEHISYYGGEPTTRVEFIKRNNKK